MEKVVWAGADKNQRAKPAVAQDLVVEEPVPQEPEIKPEQKPEQKPDLEPKAAPTPEILQPTDIAAKDQSAMLAQTVISTFTDRLKTEAEKRGGHLTADDIDQLSQEFNSKREALTVVFQQSFEHYIHLRERAAFDHARKFPFDRVIVNTLARLFDRDRVADDGPRAVTHYVLPGFFMALEMMIGPEAMEVYQARSRFIVERLSGGEESELDWTKIYADPGSKKVCFNALVIFAPYFSDIKKRQEWFLPIVNNNLAANNNWELSEGGFHNLVGEMFSELRDELADLETRKKLEDQYSGVTCFELDRAFGQMDQGG